MAKEDPLMDEAKLKDWLEANVPREGAADFHVERHQAGHSNETFFVDWGGQRLVLRRPPKGAFLPTAHDVLREYRVLQALQPHKVRVPRPVAACEDPDLIGAPFYLVERVEGAVLRESLPPGTTDVGAIGDEAIDALAELHMVEWKGTPLTSIGKPDGYLERQIARWRDQLERTVPWTQRSREVPQLFEAADWLERHRPHAQRVTVVHGDYKLDNVVFDLRGRPRLVAVLDWEMSTLGDPLADLGWLLSSWTEYGDDPRDVVEVTPMLTTAKGMRVRGDLKIRYQEATGLKLDDLRFYEVLAVWKLAVLLEGGYARRLMGQSDDAFLDKMRDVVPQLALRALRRAYT